MGLMQWRLAGLALTMAGLLWAGQAAAVPCEPSGGFNVWLEAFKREALSRGFSQRTVSALNGVSYDRKVISLDRNQRVFKQSFQQFAGRMVNKSRLSRGARLLRSHARLLSGIERRYGVPGPVIVAIWGLESDYGANMGNRSVLRALATLAYDCRRTDMFQRELVAALTIIQRGDLSPRQMRGAWAGELGQTQFLASNYVKFGVDYDGNGRRDLIRSVPDVLASTANYLRGYGWRPGGSYAEGSHNFNVIRQWNKSTVYSKTVAYFAARLAATQ